LIRLIEVVIDHLPGPAKVPAIHSDGDRRDLRLDACRGLALWFIFIDHIPDNALAWLTLRNYGFSDATEVFVLHACLWRRVARARLADDSDAPLMTGLTYPYTGASSHRRRRKMATRWTF